MDMKVSLGDKTNTTVFVKLVAPHQLLLTESLAKIVGYHLGVQTFYTKSTSMVEPSTLEVFRWLV